MHLVTCCTRLLACAVVLATGALPLRAQRQMEALGRGVIAVRTSATETYVGWRLLGTDPSTITFNLYRSIGANAATKVNPTPLITTTDYRDTLTAADFTSPVSYYVRPIIGGVELPPSAPFTLAPNSVAARQYFSLPIDPKPNPNSTYPYDVKFAWVGDLDGDGEYDFVFDRHSTSPNAEIEFLEAYKRDGTFLWRMNMGPNSVNQYNIEPGSTAISIGDCDGLTVFDLDGDGKAEVIIRTANGVTSKNAAGTEILNVTAPDDVTQYISVLDGLTGVEKARAPLPNPFRQFGPLNNRCVIAYLDGTRPSCVFHGKNREDNGTFHRIFSAFDYRNGVLTLRWTRPEDDQHPLGAEGHQLRVADVDNDGRDEIVDIGHVLDDDGTELFTTDLTHGDRYHVGDFNPNWPGLETYAIQQNNPSLLATAYYSSDTGAMFKRWYDTQIVDVGRGIALDMDPSHYGYELYSTQPGIYDASGNRIYAKNVWPPEGLWWDGDLSRELIDGAGSGARSPVVNKFNPATGNLDRIFTFYNDNGGTHQGDGGRPAFWGDILGDWREEVMIPSNDYSELRIYTTTIPATNRLYTLMHNPQYRGQATTKGYVQASYVDYYLGTDMTPPPPPPISTAKLVWQGGPAEQNTWNAGTTAAWRMGILSTTTAAFTNGDSVLLDHTGNSASPIILSGALSPSEVRVYSPNNYTLDGTSGSLTGAMPLTKLGSGTLTLTGTNDYTGPTVIWDGGLRIDGQLTNSPVTIWGGIWGGPLAGGATGGRLSGTGHIAQPVTVNFRGSIAPGAGMGNVGTLYLDGGVTTSNASTFALDVSDDPSGLLKANDRLAITGDLNLGGPTTLYINLLNGRLVAGSYTLVTYTGTLTGASNLTVAGLNGIPYSVSSSGGAITLTVLTTRAPDTLTWQGGGSWDLLTSNAWSRSGVIDGFTPGDAVTFDDTGVGSLTVDIAEPVNPLSVTVSSSSNYTFTGQGSIIGTASLTKRGSGTLTLTTNHMFTGPVSIEGGVVAVNTLADGSLPSPLGAATPASGNIVISGGTLRFIGNESAGMNRNVTVGVGGATLDTTTNGIGMQLGGVFEGPGKLTKVGPGSITLARINTYSGGTEVKGGTIILASTEANRFGLGTGPVVFNGGTVTMSDARENAVATWNMVVPAGATGRLDADGRSTIGGALTGGGVFTFFTPFIRTEVTGDWSGFMGRINVVTDADGGDLRLRNTAGMPTAELNLGDNTFTYFANTLTTDTGVPIGALSGVAGAALQGSVTAGRTLTWVVGSKNTDTTFPGTISNGAGITALTKAGTGTLTLTGANIYTGVTTVSAGMLLINGSSSNSPISVQSGATLGGTGSITGNVAFGSGSKVLLGTAPIPITGVVTLTGTVTIVSENPRADGTYGVLNATSVVGSPTWIYSGPLAVGQVATFAVNGGTINVTLTNELGRSPAAITWTGLSSGVWDNTATNWKLNIGAAATNFIDGDTANFNDSLVGNAAITIPAAVSPLAVVFSNATTPYVLSSSAGGISGTGTLNKSGLGSVALNGDNTYTGATTISGGSLAINGSTASASFTVQSGGALGGSGTITTPIVFQNGSRLLATAGGPLHVTTATLTLPSSLAVTAASYLADGTYSILDAGSLPAVTWSYSGPLYIGQSATVLSSAGIVSVTFSGTVSTRAAGPVKWSGATSGIWNTSPANNWKAVADGSATAFLNGDLVTFDDTLTANPTIALATAVQPSSVTFANATAAYRMNSSNGGISGSTTLIKNGAGTASLAGANSYTGGTIINAGILALADDTANGGGLGSGPVTLNGGTLRFNNSTGQSNGYTYDFIVPAGASARLEIDGRCGLAGTLTGAGTLEFWTPFIRTDITGDWSAFTGRLNVVTDADGGEFHFVTANGFPNAEVNIGPKVFASYTADLQANVTVSLGALSGSAPDGTLSGTSTKVRTVTWLVGAKNLSTTFAGRITNNSGPAALAKVGTGTLTLSGANTYTGPTVVSAGTLELSGSITNTGTVEVKSGATLNLTGTLTTGTLTIRSGGKLIGGGTINANVVNEGLISATGSATFAIAGNLTNASTGTIRLVRGASLTLTGGTLSNSGLLDVITAGTTPSLPSTGTVLDANSLQPTEFVYHPGAPVTLKMAIYSGHSYQLQRTLDLVAGGWQNVGGPVDGTGGAFTFSDAAPPSEAKFFYRIVIDP